MTNHEIKISWIYTRRWSHENKGHTDIKCIMIYFVFRYLRQFKEIFTEEGRKAVKITTVRPGQAPHVEFTQTTVSASTPGLSVSGNQGLLTGHASSLSAAIRGQVSIVVTPPSPISISVVVLYIQYWIEASNIWATGSLNFDHPVVKMVINALGECLFYSMYLENVYMHTQFPLMLKTEITVNYMFYWTLWYETYEILVSFTRWTNRTPALLVAVWWKGMFLYSSLSPWHPQVCAFSHRGQKCPENTWERTNVSSGGRCKTASMTSQGSYWRDVAIGSSVMTLCFEQLKRHWNQIIYLK